MAETSYMPSFIIKVNGSRLAVEQEANVLRITVIQRTDDMSRFFIEVSDPDFTWQEDDNFFIGSEVEIEMGYKDELTPVMKGDITGVSAHLTRYPGVTFTIEGRGKLHILTRAKRTQAFNEMTTADIVKQIIEDAGLEADVESLTHNHLFTLQKDLTDLEYLQVIAEKHDCIIYEEEGKVSFKRLQPNQSEDAVLEYNKTLISFTPVADTYRMLTGVEVRGWDSAKISLVSGKSAHADISGTGGKIVEDNFGEALEKVVDHMILDSSEADQMALDHLCRNARRYISGQGVAEGNPEIKAGGIIKIEGLGEKFSDKYYLYSVRHTLVPNSGYTTTFYINNLQGNPGAQGESESAESETTPIAGSGKSDKERENERAIEKAVAKAAEEENTPQPEIINLKWIDEKEEEIEIAKIDQKVRLSAETKNIEDGPIVRLQIFEHDSEGENDYIKQDYAPVKEGKIVLPWNVEFHDDRDEANRDEEDYFMPEYIFKIDTVQPKKITTEDSPILEVRGWYGDEIINKNLKEPMKEVNYTIHYTDGRDPEEGTTDEEGKFEQEELQWGEYLITINDKEKIDTSEDN